ncbi:MAG: hypothetical protein K9K67_01965 [Bacteriovoracaceae bacterium]|nr:hypothetical protein [Bacteriovoracaceae bacterium]
MRINWFIVIFLTLQLKITLAQSVVDDIGSFSNGLDSNVNPELSTEKIEKIGATGRIFILTNNSSSYGKGDFISIVLDNKLVNRSLVAKTTSGSGGIKIMKVYNPELHKLLRPGMDVQIIRGDDSYFKLKKKQEEDPESTALINDEEGLFDETTLLEDDLNLEENTSRKIKTDNIFSLYLSQVEGQGVEQDTRRYSQITGAYAYQVNDNFWAEVSYGENVINDFPDGGLDTKFSSLVFKIKYTVEAPFYSFIQPYAGYQITRADSPGAGSGEITPEQQEAELDLVESLQKNQPVFGVTILKRLVPGWFARLDIGSDALNFGFALEF